jgi:hypothetical protein
MIDLRERISEGYEKSMRRMEEEWEGESRSGRKKRWKEGRKKRMEGRYNERRNEEDRQ